MRNSHPFVTTLSAAILTGMLAAAPAKAQAPATATATATDSAAVFALVVDRLLASGDTTPIRLGRVPTAPWATTLVARLRQRDRPNSDAEPLAFERIVFRGDTARVYVRRAGCRRNGSYSGYETEEVFTRAPDGWRPALGGSITHLDGGCRPVSR